MLKQEQENLSQPEKIVIHRLLSGTKCSNREDCPCGPKRIEEADRIYWVHGPVLNLFSVPTAALNELVAK